MSSRGSRRRGSFPLKVLPSIPSLIVRSGLSCLRAKSTRSKGVGRFRKELKGSGLSREQIESLSGQYEDIGRRRNLARIFDLF
ncbi:MAG: hypothetical protein ACE5KV_00895 [Thermoplasmata archaeon]